jgi:hypothetical protein
MQGSASVLLYGRDQMLLVSQRLLLENAGFKVFQAMNLKEMHSVSAVQRIHLIIVGENISPDEEQIALCVALAFNPKASILTWNEVTSSECRHFHHGIYLKADDGQPFAEETFLAAVEEALQSAK